MGDGGGESSENGILIEEDCACDGGVCGRGFDGAMPAAIAVLNALIVLDRRDWESVCCSRATGLCIVVSTGFALFPWLACLRILCCAGGVPGSLCLL